MTTIYDELESAWKREFHGLEVQPLRPGFFKELSLYARRLREAQQNLDPKSLKAVLLEEESFRLEQLFSQLLDHRLHKIWFQARTAQSSDLESVEKQADQTLSSLHRDYENMKLEISQGRAPSVQRSKSGEFVLVRFEKDVPSIIGVDLKTHGPFNKEDLARLPQENAVSLIRQGAAIEITTSSQDNE